MFFPRTRFIWCVNVFDVSSPSWKGNTRSRPPQCCSHLCPLMMGPRLSRPSHGRLCHETQRRRYSPWPFIVVSAHSDQLSRRMSADRGRMGVTQGWRPRSPPRRRSSFTTGVTQYSAQHYYFQSTIVPTSLYFSLYLQTVCFYCCTFLSLLDGYLC